MTPLLQGISNWFALALMLVGALALLLSNASILPPDSMLLAAVPLVLQLLARGANAPGGLRIAAMAVNWVAAVLAGSLAAVSLTGIGGNLQLSPLLCSAAVLYGWNALSDAMRST
jgi:hypothetical protein